MENYYTIISYCFFSDLSIPFEDNHLSAARSIVLEYIKTLEEKRNTHEKNMGAQPSETIVFLGKNPDTPPSEQASNLDRQLDSVKYLNLPGNHTLLSLISSAIMSYRQTVILQLSSSHQVVIR